MTRPFELAPHNQEAEQGLLGCLFSNNRVYDEIALITETDHFFLPAHQRIFDAIKEAVTKNKPASPVHLASQFHDDPDLKNIGGASYLAQVAGSILTPHNAMDYAETLKDLWQRRRLIIAAQEIIQNANDYKLENRGMALAHAEKAITTLGDIKTSTSYTAAEAVQKSRRWAHGVRSGKIKQFLTGFARLDEKISGLYAGRLYIIGARPGMGKTTLALNIADNISRHQQVVFMSLEMPAEEIGMRLDAARTGISITTLQGLGDVDSDQENALRESMREICLRNLTIEDSSGVDIHGLKSLARRHKRRYGKFVFIIDYIGLITPDYEIRNKVHQIEDITTNLKRLAKELEIPIILLCQLSRRVESLDDKRPSLADLRDSGSIEQDADVVMFIYRGEYYDSKNPPEYNGKETHEKYQEKVLEWEQKIMRNKGKAEIIIAKNRQGKSGVVEMNFSGHKQLFFE